MGISLFGGVLLVITFWAKVVLGGFGAIDCCGVMCCKSTLSVCDGGEEGLLNIDAPIATNKAAWAVTDQNKGTPKRFSDDRVA